MEIFEEKREESFQDGGPQVTRTLRVVPYAERLAAVALLMPSWLVTGDNVEYTRGHQDPWIKQCYCVDAQCVPIEALNGPTNVPTSGRGYLDVKSYADSARIVAKYKPFIVSQQNTEPTELEIADQAWDFKATAMKLPKLYWTFPDGTFDVLRAEDLEVTKIIPQVDYILTRNYCVKIPQEAIMQLLGRVNRYPFKVGGRTWPAETLRFDAAGIQQKISTNSLPFYQIVYRFAAITLVDNIITNEKALEDAGFSISGSGVVVHFGNDYVGWNRIFRPSKDYWCRPRLAANIKRRIYQYDRWDADASPPVATEDQIVKQTIKGKVVQGFDLLFNPSAV